MLGPNVRMGETAGCAAIPGAEDQALRDVEEALRVADATRARAVHVLAGRTSADDAREVPARNLSRFATTTNRTALMEPLSRRAMPGCALSRLDRAARIIAAVGAPNVRVPFDRFHVLAEGEDLRVAFDRHAHLVGHVQMASYPGRNEPGRAGPDHRAFLTRLSSASMAWVGCEFIPTQQPIRAPDLR